MYLVLSVFTSSPVSLVASTKASAFSLTYSVYTNFTLYLLTLPLLLFDVFCVQSITYCWPDILRA